MFRLALRVTPRAAQDAIDAVEQDAQGQPRLLARVRSAPSDGSANKAVLRLIAGWLGVAPSVVTLARGAAGREKLVEVAADPRLLSQAIETWRRKDENRA